MTENLSYIISEKDYDKKIYPYLKKLAEVMRSKTNEFYNFDAEIITKEKEVIHYLYDGTEVNAILNKDKNMIVSMLPSLKHKKLINKLEKLAIK